MRDFIPTQELLDAIDKCRREADAKDPHVRRQLEAIFNVALKEPKGMNTKITLPSKGHSEETRRKIQAAALAHKRRLEAMKK